MRPKAQETHGGREREREREKDVRGGSVEETSCLRLGSIERSSLELSIDPSHEGFGSLVRSRGVRERGCHHGRPMEESGDATRAARHTSGKKKGSGRSMR